MRRLLPLTYLAVLCGALALGVSPAPARTVEETVEPIRPVVLMVEADYSFGRRTYGSGFLISSDGLVATCQHIVSGAQEISCYYRNSQRLRAKLVAEDTDLDLAVLKLESEEVFPTATLGDSDVDVLEGTAVGVMGYPTPSMYFSLGVGLDSTTTSGTVSGLRLGDRAENRSRNAVLQLDLMAWRGNSGGPVFRIEDGKVIGLLVSAVFERDVYFALPINQFKAFLASKGINLKVAPVRADDLATLTLEPGTVDALVAIRDDREMATTFVAKRQLVQSEWLRSQADLTSKFFTPAFGFVPSAHPEVVVEGRDLFLGGLDSQARCLRQRRLSTDLEWDLELDYPVYVPVAVDKDNVVVGAGGLTYDTSEGSLSLGTSLLRGLTGLGGLFGKARMQRTLNTMGTIYVLDRDDGRVKAQADTAFPTTPVIRDGIGYVGALGQLMAMELDTGSVKWSIGDLKREVESRMWYNVALAPDGSLYTLDLPVQLAIREVNGSRSVYLEAGTGKSHDGPGGNDLMLRRRDPKTGQPDWEVRIGNPRDYLRPLATNLVLNDEGTVAYVKFGPTLAAVDLKAHKLLWPEADELDARFEQMNKVCWERRLAAERDGWSASQALLQTSVNSGVSNSLTLAGSRLYHGAYDLAAEGQDRSYLQVVEAENGEEVKQLPCPGRATAPLVRDGVIYFGASHTGTIRRGRGEPESWLYAYNESTLEELWRLRVDNNGFAYAPRMVGRTLYFTDGEEFYSLALPER